MERRVLLAVFLSFLVLYFYQALIGPPPAERPAAGPPASPASPPAPGGLPPPPPGVRDAPVAGAAAPTTPAARDADLVAADVAADPVVADTEVHEIVVESERFRAVFTNRGAELLSWQLADYLDAGQPVELVPRDLPPGEPAPFALAFEDDLSTRLAGEALYRPSARRVRLADRAETLTFDYEDAGGLRIRKTFRFDPASSPYLMTLTVEAARGQETLDPALRWGPALGGGEYTTSGFAFRQGPRGVLYGRLLEGGVIADAEVTRPNAGDVTAQPTYQGQLAFVGVDNHYFLAAALPGSQQATVRYRAVPLPPRTVDDEPRELMAFDLRLAGGLGGLPFYLGPKDFDILEIADPVLPRAIEFGFLSWLVVPLHRSLSWVHAGVGNWGLSIIILTILINIVIFPLRHKSVVSMRKMQDLQPEMKAIQERYKHLKATDPDKQKMNQEVMALYRDRGVNPASGCLPMLATMPILFAFYRLLTMAIEIRGAPFLLWITDLSVHDPLYITPLVMGASMVVQQRLSPAQVDAMQQRMMMLMPVVFTFMFLWAPSGLVLYWLTSNVLGIGQQVITNRLIGPPKTRVVRPPAERRVRKPRRDKGGKKAASSGRESAP